MEIAGGPTSPNFDEYLDSLKTLDSHIKKAKGEIEQLKSQKRKLNPIVSSLLASLSASDAVESTKRYETASIGVDSSAAPSAEVEVLRRSPTAMSTLTDDSVQVQKTQMMYDLEDGQDGPHDVANVAEV
jgi:hypothetical protein